MKIPLLSKGYVGRSTSIDASRMVNWYPELTPDGKSVAALIQTPGLTLWINLSAGAVRGMHVYNSLLYVVVGAFLYSINNAGTSTILNPGNPMTTTSGRVVMSDNGLSPTGGNQLAIADGDFLYIWNVNAATWTQTAITAHSVAFIDGYFVCDIGGMEFQVSALYDGTTWSGLDVAAVAAYPDNLLYVLNNMQFIWFFGSYHSEVWFDAGTSHPPLALLLGATSMYGLAAQYSVVKADNSVFWLAQQLNNDQGELFGLVRANGYTPELVTPPAIMYQWSQYVTVSDAFTYSYTMEGHTFVVITFPSANATWAYDCSTKLWHERSSYPATGPYVIGRHIGNAYAYFNGMHLLGDYSNGNLYKMSSAVYQDNGQPIVSDRIFRHLSDEDDYKRVFYHRLQIDVETGVGDNNLVTNPQASLRWSDDGGHTYSDEMFASMGTQGQYKTRMIFNRLGSSRDRIFWLRISDPVKRIIVGAAAKMELGVN